MSEQKLLIYNNEPEIKVYFINPVKKTVGSLMAWVQRKPQGNGKDQLQITYETTLGDLKDKVQYYFNEQEWLDEIKKM